MIARAQQQHAGRRRRRISPDCWTLCCRQAIGLSMTWRPPVVYPQVPQQTLLGLQRYESLFIAASCLLFG